MDVFDGHGVDADTLACAHEDDVWRCPSRSCRIGWAPWMVELLLLMVIIDGAPWMLEPCISSFDAQEIIGDGHTCFFICCCMLGDWSPLLRPVEPLSMLWSPQWRIVKH